ncbi:hypothetical protein PILCRDRAFT_829349 [Piloderma croceum F 1598]|uniref:Uncharacterized protein n=1 Tax=Piloderma croceum (strain F 1598) TaxID=765440 RepID=A0A0C3AH99_PILCF|nr:hypothetical protein PILCRDRAFT_829349 [Piloderma croceum F 1598]
MPQHVLRGHGLHFFLSSDPDSFVVGQVDVFDERIYVERLLRSRKRLHLGYYSLAGHNDNSRLEKTYLMIILGKSFALLLLRIVAGSADHQSAMISCE